MSKVIGDGDMVQQKLEEVDQDRREERVSDALENMSSNDVKKVVDGAVRASKVINWDNMAKLLVSDEIGAVKIMTNYLIRTRHQITKFYALKSQLQGVSLRIQTLKSTQAMGEAMKRVTESMWQMTRQMNLLAL
ncbi:hypothetical protein ZEAMMB73_Zm00001d028738 [Zea mays]|uniref:Uncharacterized protein n=1 Tax=Zea mays TaxID=4577 RepID=A0A1D6JZ51_MAIZE|nr:hypothetical protein ZEAMMB73_Zm00001d028738 [Zea mays]